jgi:hypothetical protein
MDMIDKDERLLQQFFSEAANQKIEDNGFTERVMQRLASANVQRSAFNVQRISRLWTWFCITVFAVLFVVFHGWELLAVQLEVMLRTMATQSLSINLLMLFTVVFGLLFVGTGEVISSELARK